MILAIDIGNTTVALDASDNDIGIADINGDQHDLFTSAGMAPVFSLTRQPPFAGDAPTGPYSATLYPTAGGNTRQELTETLQFFSSRAKYPPALYNLPLGQL